MNNQPYSENDEINLSEIFSALWYHKALIAIATCFGVLLAAHLIITTERKFTAVAIFDINSGDQPKMDIRGDLGALASFAGLTNQSFSKKDILIERVKSREFILDASSKLDFSSDPFFNSYRGRSQESLLKSTIKDLVGWKTSVASEEAIIEKTIIASFRKNISTETTETGTIKISVIHKNPDSAAFYANSLMEQIRNLVDNENKISTEQRLTYLSETLADALQDMDIAQQKLKDYTLKNSVAAEENFISGSLKLDTMRMELRRVKEIVNVLEVINSLLKQGPLDNRDYMALREKHPLVDDIGFRRILGMSEIISSWSWPNVEVIETSSVTLKDRMKRLNNEIAAIENNAKIYASSAEDLAKYTRDAKIAEATYTVLIEQVKSQSLAAGFKPETFKVFEYATAPISSSSPNRKLILFLGTIIGFAAGCLLSILNSIRKGVFYTKSNLFFEAETELFLSSRSFRRFSASNSKKLLDKISKQTIPELDEAKILLNNKKVILLINCGSRVTTVNAARLMSIKNAQSGKTTLICDTSGNLKPDLELKNVVEISGNKIAKTEYGFDFLHNFKETAFFTAANFSDDIQNLSNSYDQIYICSNSTNSKAGLLALKPMNASTVLLTRLRKTRKSDIVRIKSILPITLVFND